MKHTLYIISLVAALFFAACDEPAVIPDSVNEPIQKVGLKIYNRSYLSPLPDGSIVTLVSAGKEGQYCVAKVKTDGSYILSDTLTEGVLFDRLYVNAEGESLICQFEIDSEGWSGYKLYKIDTKGNVYDKGFSDYWSVTLFDNGNIACFGREQLEPTGDETLVMRIIDNNLTYIMGQDFETDFACTFGDRIMLANYGIGEYCIFKTDGSFVNRGSIDNFITKIQSLDGYFYVVAENINRAQDEESEKSDNANTEWLIYKIDANGNIVYSTTINTFVLNGHFSIIDGMLVTTGVYSSDHSRNEGYGTIYLINNENGQLIETISVNYNGCEVLPLSVAADNNNGYNVYVLRQDTYDTNRQPFEMLKSGNLFIYHTNDLHTLNINNTINQ